MNRPLLLLLLLSLRGRFMRRLKLLRQPRYLVGLLVGLAYFALVLGPRLLTIGSAGHRGPRIGIGVGGGPDLGELLPVVQWGVALGLAVLATLAWFLTSSQPALRLTETELHLLLPAPLPRRRILEFALLKQQAGILFGTFIIGFFVRGGGLPLDRRLGRLAASWALLTLTDLYVKGIGFWKAELKEKPLAVAVRKRAIAIAIGAALWAVVVFFLLRAWNATGGLPSVDEAGVKALGQALLAQLRQGPLGLLLLPFLWLIGPFLGAGSWAGTVFVLVAIVVLFEWVVRSSASFEEATLARAQRQLEKRTRKPRFARLSARARERVPFALAATGRPEMAIYWKNLILLGRTPFRRQALYLVLAFAAVTAGVAAFGAPVAVTLPLASIGAMLMVMPPLMAGLLFRNDLRTDLLQIEILRPWPIASWRLVAAELLAPTTTAFRSALLGASLVLAAATATLFTGNNLAAGLPRALARFGPAPEVVVLGVLSVLLLGIPIALISAGVQNLAALLLPGWVGLGMERKRGTAIFGQRILMLLGQLVVLLAAALPAALAVALVLLVQRLAGWSFTAWDLPVCALAAALPLFVVAGFMTRLGGALWDRLDPARELLEPPES